MWGLYRSRVAPSPPATGRGAIQTRRANFTGSARCAGSGSSVVPGRRDQRRRSVGACGSRARVRHLQGSLHRPMQGGHLVNRPLSLRLRRIEAAATRALARTKQARRPPRRLNQRDRLVARRQLDRPHTRGTGRHLARPPRRNRTPTHHPHKHRRQRPRLAPTGPMTPARLRHAVLWTLRRGT